MGEAQDWQDVDKRYRSVIEALKANEEPGSRSRVIVEPGHSR